MSPIAYSTCPAWQSATGVSRAGGGPYIQDDDMLGRATVPEFGNYISRLRSFALKSWPHPKRSPIAFIAAGFFHNGKVLCVWTVILIYISSTTTFSFILNYRVRYLSHLLTGHAYETRFFHFVGGFRGWLGDDDNPWQEHI